MARRVEIELVGDRLADARLAQAYAVLAPERRRVTANERRDDEPEQQRQDDLAGGGPVGQGRGDLRAGVLGSSAAGADDPQSDRRVA